MKFRVVATRWRFWIAGTILLATGCATVGPVALRDELAKPKAAIRTDGGQEIRGYFDGHGFYHEWNGDVRTRDGQLEVRTYSADLSQTRWRSASVDTLKTVMIQKSNLGRYGGVFGVTLLAVAAAVIIVYLYNL